MFNVFYLWDTDMRRDVQEIFKMTPHDKQVMMFSATLSKEIRPVCKKFMQDVIYWNFAFLFIKSMSCEMLDVKLDGNWDCAGGSIITGLGEHGYTFEKSRRGHGRPKTLLLSGIVFNKQLTFQPVNYMRILF